MKNLFKPEDFESLFSLSVYDIADKANERLNSLIESWPVVKTYWNSPGLPHPSCKWSAIESCDSHYQARLAFIEPIVKEDCKHEPDYRLTIDNVVIDDINCKHCRTPLKPTWTAK